MPMSRRFSRIRQLNALFRALSCVFVLVLSANAGAKEMDLTRCAFSQPPVIAEGATATQEQMTASATAVRSFMGAMQDSLDCLEAAEKAMGDEITEEQKIMVTAAYNSGVDKLNKIAERYNSEVRAFKNR